MKGKLSSTIAAFLSSYVPLTDARPVKGFAAGPTLGVSLDQSSHEFIPSAGSLTANPKLNTKFAFGASGAYLYQVSSARIVTGAIVDFLVLNGTYSADLRDSTGTSEGKITVKPKYTGILTGITGVMINPKICTYAKIGYAFTNVKIAKTTPAGTKNTAKWVKGMIPGAGGIYFFSPSMLICADYGYFMPSKASSGEDADKSARYNTRNHLVTLKLLWLF